MASGHTGLPEQLKLTGKGLESECRMRPGFRERPQISVLTFEQLHPQQTDCTARTMCYVESSSQCFSYVFQDGVETFGKAGKICLLGPDGRKDTASV